MKFIYKLFLLFFAGLCLGTHGFGQQNGPEKIDLTNQQKTITIYPMPVSNTAHIRLSTSLRAEVNKIEIINLIGRKLTEQVLLDQSTTDVSFTNLNEYPDGIYMVVARDKFGKIVQSAKMIINR